MYTDDLDVRVYAPVACQENHYYPFGLNMATIEYVGEPGTPYQFNGKEKEDVFDLCWYDYGARWYDPQLGRWFNADPAEQVASPYDFCGGDPVANVDPDGRSFSRWSAQNESSIVLANIAVAGVVVSIATAGSASAPMVVVYAAAAGALMGGLAAAYAGANGEQIAGCAFVGAAVGALTANVGSGLPQAWFSTMAGSIVTGAALGAASGALQGGLTHLVMGRSFGNGAKQGAIGGAIGGGIGGMIGYMMNPGKAGNTAKGEGKEVNSNSGGTLAKSENMDLFEPRSARIGEANGGRPKTTFRAPKRFTGSFRSHGRTAAAARVPKVNLPDSKMYFGSSVATISGAFAASVQKIGIHYAYRQNDLFRRGFNTEEDWNVRESSYTTKGLEAGLPYLSMGVFQEFRGNTLESTTINLNSIIFGYSATYNRRTELYEHFVGVDFGLSFAFWYGVQFKYSAGYKFYTK